MCKCCMHIMNTCTVGGTTVWACWHKILRGCVVHGGSLKRVVRDLDEDGG